MRRLIIDPNILASVILGGITGDRFDKLLQHLERFDICYSDTLIEEVARFSKIAYFKKKGIDERAVLEFIYFFQSISIKILATSKVKLGRDQNDYYLLGLSRDARADFLISGDPDLLEIGKYGKTQIVTMKTFVEIFDLG